MSFGSPSRSVLGFEIVARDSKTRARRAVARTPHGCFDTPAFMPVATHGTVKGVDSRELATLGVEILLGNAFHLALRPGVDTFRAFGGIHRFSGWCRPLLTDSGGFQVFSLAKCREISDAGARFRSPIDGSIRLVSPEESIRMQQAIGADLIMAFDECPPAGAPPEVVRKAAERTRLWAERCLSVHDRSGPQALLGIVQGGTDLALRSDCARDIASMPFDSFAIGGVAVGEGPEQIRSVVRHTAPLLPDSRIRYLMGVGPPDQILMAIGEGIDLFDCVIPSRNGRNGTAFTSTGLVRIKNAARALEDGPLDPECDCPTCRQGLPRAFLRHLFAIGDHLGGALVTRHNIAFYESLLAGARLAISEHRFEAYRERWTKVFTRPPDAT